MSERPPPPRRGDYVTWRTVTTRWRDDDAYGHMNNATYYELFDTAVNAFLYEESGVDVRALPAVGVVAETSCRYFREIGFPEPVEVGMRIERLGTSSMVYRIGLFQGDGDEAAAEGRFVHVYVESPVASDEGRGPRPSRPSRACCGARWNGSTPPAPAPADAASDFGPAPRACDHGREPRPRAGGPVPRRRPAPVAPPE